MTNWNNTADPGSEKIHGPDRSMLSRDPNWRKLFSAIGWRMSLMPGAMVALRICFAVVSAAASGRRLGLPILACRRQSLRRRGRRVAVPVAVLGSHMFITGRWSRPTASISILVTTIRQCLITISAGYVPIQGTLSTAFPFKDPATKPPSASLGALNSGNSIRWRCLPASMGLDRSIDAILAAFFSVRLFSISAMAPCRKRR